MHRQQVPRDSEVVVGPGLRLVKGEDLVSWLDGQSPNTWTELLREAVEEYALETGGAETPVDHFVEWLAEWGRDARRRQRGLLLSAHRAKGLEFNHVVVLDDRWDRVSRGEDADTPRRLHYVAMTRARQTLALVRFPGPHPVQDVLRDAPAVLCRDISVALPPASRELSRHYRRLSLQDVFLSFTGNRRPDDPVHGTIAALSPRDPLQTREGANRWELLDRTGPSWGSWPAASGPPSACAAPPPRSWPSPPGTGRVRNLSTGTASTATPGRSSFRSWCSSRTGSPAGGYQMAA